MHALYPWFKTPSTKINNFNFSSYHCTRSPVWYLEGREVKIFKIVNSNHNSHHLHMHSSTHRSNLQERETLNFLYNNSEIYYSNNSRFSIEFITNLKKIIINNLFLNVWKENNEIFLNYIFLVRYVDSVSL